MLALIFCCSNKEQEQHMPKRIGQNSFDTIIPTYGAARARVPEYYPTATAASAPMICPMFSGAKNSENGTVPAIKPKKRLVCS